MCGFILIIFAAKCLLNCIVYRPSFSDLSNFNGLLALSRSPIHRRGLFCLRDIDAGEMVIEYTGNVIRSVLTDKREKYYESRVGIIILYFLRFKSLSVLSSKCSNLSSLDM